MKKCIKLFSAMVAVVMCMTAFSACTGTPKSSGSEGASVTGNSGGSGNGILSDNTGDSSTDDGDMGSIAVRDDSVIIYLVRHGKTLFNTIGKVQGFVDSPLTDVGIEGAEDTGMGLAGVKFDAVFSSDRGRAVETAEIIMSLNNAAGDMPVITLADMRETNYGKYEGSSENIWEIGAKSLGAASMAELNKFSQKEIIDAIAASDETGECENYDEAVGRLMRGLNQISGSIQSGNILCVAHGNAISNIVSALGGSSEGELPNSSVTIVTYKEGKYAVESVGGMLENEAGKAAREANGGKAVYPKGKEPSDAAIEAGSGKVNLYIVRHGKTLLNTSGRMQGIADAPLTEAGVQGVVNTGLGLKDLRFDGIYSSDLGRTIETIDLMLSVNEATSAEVPRTKLKDLREYSFGKFEGDLGNDVQPLLFKAGGISSYEEMAEKHISIIDLYDALSKDADTQVEAGADFRRRIKRGVDVVAAEMSAKGDETNALVVVHGLVMSAVLEDLGIPVTAEIPNAAVVKVICQNGEYSVDKDHAIDLSYSEKGAALNPFKQTDPGQLDSLTPELFALSGKEIPVYTLDGIQYFPVRALAEAAGANVTLDKAADSVIIIANGRRAALKLNSNQYYVDKTIHFLESGSITQNTEGASAGETFAPAESILAPLGIGYTVSDSEVLLK